MEHFLAEKFLIDTLTALVDSPQDIHVDTTIDNMGVLMTVSLNQSDVGKVIGRSGNTVNSLRTLLRVVGMKNNARVSLKINESLTRSPRQYHHDDQIPLEPF